MIPAVFLFFFPFAYDSYTLPRIALAAVLLASAWYLSRRWGPKPLTVPMLVMFACVAASAVASGDLLVNTFGRYMSRYLGLVPLALCVVAYHLPPQRIHAAMRWAGGLMAVYAASQLAGSPLSYEVAAGGRVIGTLGSPPALGCALAMCLPFCWGQGWRRSLLFGVVVASLLATGSRGPILAALVAMAVMAAPKTPRRLAGVMAAILVGSGALYLAFNHGLSDSIRAHTWISSLRIWWAHPWLGSGAETYMDAWRPFQDARWISMVGHKVYQDHAHNDFLQALAAFGLAGAAAYGWLLWSTWKRLRRMDSAGYYGAPVSASIAAMFICAKFNAVPFACLFAAALMLGSLDESSERWSPEPVFFLTGILSIFLCATVYADVVFYRARKVLDFPGIMRAAEINPAELFYQASMADLLTRKWGATGEPELLVRAVAISREALHLHPSSVQAQHILTQNLIILAQRYPQYLREAQRSAIKLNALDPNLNYKFTIRYVK